MKRIWPYQNRTLKSLRGEEWSDLPGYEGEYEISTLGRIKSLRRWHACGKNCGYYTKEIIRKQHIRKGWNNFKKDHTYCVGITLKQNGKNHSTSTARLVYNAFVESFDLSNKNLVITYKDNNGKNISYQNLVLSTLSEKCKKIIVLQRSHPKWMDLKVKVQQLTLDGELIAVYDSVQKAAEATGFKRSGISACMRGKIYHHKKFKWERAETTPQSSIQSQTNKSQIFNRYLWEKIGKPKTSKRNPIPALNLSLKNLPGEKWKPITGTEGYYISNLGRVKGIGRFKHNCDVWTKELMKRLIPDGTESRSRPTSCLLAHITIKGKTKQVSVTRLVYSHFVSPFDLNDKTISVKCKNGCFYDLNPQNLYKVEKRKG